MLPQEILYSVPKDSDFFSVVISNLDNKISIDSIQPRVYIQDDQGRIRKTTGGAPMARYANVDDYEQGICSKPVMQYATPYEIYNGVSREQKMTADSIKNTLNHFPGAVWWHDGKADDNCKFHGLHMHAIIACEKELSKTYHFRTFRNRLNNVSGKIPGSDSTPIDVKTQHVKHFRILL